MLEHPSASELTQRIDRRRLLQHIGATVGAAGFAAILAPSLSVSAYAATGGSGPLAQQSAGNDQAPAASLAGSSAGAAGDASSLPSSSLDDSWSAGAAGAGAADDTSSLPSSSLDDSGSAGAGAASGAAQAPSPGSATLTNYDD